MTCGFLLSQKRPYEASYLQQRYACSEYYRYKQATADALQK
jgi:hypothetical protein